MSAVEERGLIRALKANIEKLQRDNVEQAKQYNLLWTEVREIQDYLEQLKLENPVEPDGT